MASGDQVCRRMSAKLTPKVANIVPLGTPSHRARNARTYGQPTFGKTAFRNESARIPASFDEREGAMIKGTAMEGAASRCCFKELVPFESKSGARMSFTIA